MMETMIYHSETGNKGFYQTGLLLCTKNNPMTTVYGGGSDILRVILYLATPPPPRVSVGVLGLEC